MIMDIFNNKHFQVLYCQVNCYILSCMLFLSTFLMIWNFHILHDAFYFRSIFEGELSDTIPVFQASIADTAIVGRLSVGKCCSWLVKYGCLNAHFEWHNWNVKSRNLYRETFQGQLNLWYKLKEFVLNEIETFRFYYEYFYKIPTVLNQPII